MKPAFFLLLFTLLIGCRNEASIGPLEGLYGGTFQRDINEPAQVTITFTNGRYSGTVGKTSNLLVLPPVIGKGTFSTSGKTVSFTDETAYPANTDLSAALQGKYNAELRNGKLILQRDLDRYVLEKK
ncbi:hypothetical protein HNV11_04555 [Spirosoma taeanense]|uniref:META domain-containing protein n=1 Tax=Spirosoma taeanense TaxID=2735870 RepID=A0A6M5Y1Y3_9BACT|nr:hypothetical protein [Spirosoma taeanense]QJW88698.1 hypothetical protein HNV11_04555 [Spirosoma taeanense]